MHHAVANTKTLAPVAGILHQLDLRMVPGIFASNRGSVVTRAIIDDENFCVPLLFRHVAEDFIQRGPNTTAFVVGGNDEAVSQEQFSVLSSQGYAVY